MIRPIRRARQAVTIVRNLWFLRGEIYAIFRRRQHARRNPPIPVVCLHCRRPLTKPCRPARRAHVIEHKGKRWYVARTKPGQPATDIREHPF